MRFCQLTMKDDVILGDFVIEHVQTADGVVPMFVGIVAGEAKPSPDLSKLSPAQRERARMYAGRKPDGKRVAIPVGAVVWAEVGDEDDGVVCSGKPHCDAPPGSVLYEHSIDCALITPEPDGQ